MRARSLLPALAFIAAGTWHSAEANAPDKRAEPSIERGREAYRSYCASCHGARGGGDGPIAEVLKVPPADLTQIRNRNQGTFPKEKLEKIIDGRDASLARVHGNSDMPIWGERLAQEVPGSDAKKNDHVRRRIGFILRYLESIQAPTPGAGSN